MCSAIVILAGLQNADTIFDELLRDRSYRFQLKPQNILTTISFYQSVPFEGGNGG